MEVDTVFLDEQLRRMIPLAVEGQALVSKSAWERIDELLDCRQTLVSMGRVALLPVQE